ncbi:MAG: LCP family protein [Coriobacteriales bacterium]|jgi:LCP family protein required for cell wall assembly|nr:LCP family protein [Coriobacteriales bacterium]
MDKLSKRRPPKRSARRWGVSSAHRPHAQIDLVSARAAGASAVVEDSSKRKEKTFEQRVRHSRHRNRIIMVSLVSLVCVVVAVLVVYFAYFAYLDNQLHQDLDQPALNSQLSSAADPTKQPFYALLCGIDDQNAPESAQSILLCYVDATHGHITVTSLPRDLKVAIAGHGTQKLANAYTYGGQAGMVSAVSGLLGLKITVYAQLDLAGLSAMVDALGGVQLNVPLDIPSGSADQSLALAKGLQQLSGAECVTLCSSTDYSIGDFQRQANVRTLVQVLIAKIEAAAGPTGLTSLAPVCAHLSCTLSSHQLLDIAGQFAGIQPYDIYSYAVSCYSDVQNGITYQALDGTGASKFFDEIQAGQYPDLADMKNQGNTPEQYQPQAKPFADATGQAQPGFDTSQFTVDVWNGYGIPNAARSVSDMLGMAGYHQGKTGNAASFVYTETLVVYKSDKDLAAARDILARIGYGRLIASEGRYTFPDDVLVVVGGDYKG